MDHPRRQHIWESESGEQEKSDIRFGDDAVRAQARGTEMITRAEADQMVQDALRDMREEGITDGAVLLIKAWAERDDIAEVMNELMKPRPKPGAMGQLLSYVQDSLYG